MKFDGITYLSYEDKTISNNFQLKYLLFSVRIIDKCRIYSKKVMAFNSTIISHFKKKSNTYYTFPD